MSTLCFGQSQKLNTLPKQLQGIIPDFEALTIENETGLTRDILKEKAKKAGAKRIAISFFATWCINCREELILLKENASELKENKVQVYLIDVGENLHKYGSMIRDTVNAYAGTSFPFFFDPNGNILKKSGFVQESGRFPLPLIFILDAADLRVLGVLKGASKDDFPQILWSEL